MTLDNSRHISVIDNQTSSNASIDIIGCGATGSKIALSLSKLADSGIRVWDDDVVEPHNIPNQAFFPEHVGKYKVEALQEMVSWKELDCKAEKYNGQRQLGNIVFLLVDSMEERVRIFNDFIKDRHEGLMIETRTGSDTGRIYSIDTSKEEEISYWEGTLYSDDNAEVSSCGSTISVGPTNDIISGYAVWSAINYMKNKDIYNRGITINTYGDVLTIND